MRYMHLSNLPLSIIILAAAWTIFWKGAALWNAARKHDKGWFIAILLINTLGILELIYLFAVAKVKTDKLFK